MWEKGVPAQLIVDRAGAKKPEEVRALLEDGAGAFGILDDPQEYKEDVREMVAGRLARIRQLVDKDLGCVLGLDHAENLEKQFLAIVARASVGLGISIENSQAT